MSAIGEARGWCKKAQRLRDMAASEPDLEVKAKLEAEAKECDREARIERGFAKMEAGRENEEDWWGR